MKQIWNDFAKPIVVLGVICLVTSLLLAFTNDLTQPIIVANAEKKANETRAELLPAADTFSKAELAAPVEGVSEAFAADNGSGYVITAAAKGYAGPVPVMVAFNEEGSIEAVRFLSNEETPGLGQKVMDPAFQSQFSGMPSESFGLDSIDAITGATFSSKAAVDGINAAISAYHQLTGEGGAAAPEKLDVTAEGVTEAYRGEGVYVLCTEAESIAARVTLDETGVIVSVEFDTSAIKGDVGEKIGEPVFTQQFEGKTELSGIEAVENAEVSSKAAVGAVQAALDAFDTVKGA